MSKHPGGRPSEYDPAVLEEVDKYLETTGREQTKLPKLTEFYRHIGISKQCADEWKDKYPEFGDACKKIEERQMESLIDDGLYGGKEVNPGMAIFLLKVNHKMVEVERKEHTGKDGEALFPTPILSNVSSHDRNQENTEAE
jgi:hypothetical protein